MAEVITRRSLPPEWKELSPGYKPLSIDERDCQRIVPGEDGFNHLRKRRTRVLTYLDADQNPAVLPYDLGPATGEEGVTIPCAGAVEMSQVWDMLEWYEAKLEERKQREEWVKPIRTEAFLEGLRQEQEELNKRVAGQSVDGPHYRKERNSG